MRIKGGGGEVKQNEEVKEKKLTKRKKEEKCQGNVKKN